MMTEIRPGIFVPNYEFAIAETGRFVQIVVFWLFIAVFYGVWSKMYCISRGHDWLGKLTAVVLSMAGVLMAVGPERITLVRVLIYGSLSLYGLYNIWFFTRYPIPKEYLRHSGRIALPTKPVFVPRNALLRYLREDGPVKKSFIQSNAFRYGALALAVVLALLYGYSRSINSYTTGLLTGVQTIAQTEKQTAIAFANAVESTTMAVAIAVDTIQQGQKRLEHVADSTTQATRAVIAQSEKKRANEFAGLQTQIKRVNQNVERTRRSVDVPELLKPTGPTNFLLPDKVRPLPPTNRDQPNRKRRFGHWSNRSEELDEYAQKPE